MALVNMEEWLAERGLLRAAPEPEASTSTGALEEFQAQLTYQADLISRLQTALRGLLDELARVQAPPRKADQLGSPSRVIRRPRAAPAFSAAPPPAPDEG